MDIPVYSIAGQVLRHVTVDEAALGGAPSKDLVRQAILMYEANQRVGTVRVKTKETVAGTGRKPWPQKHTGRARHGTRVSPIWVGGAVAHGPRPRDYRQKMPKSARQRALCSAFLMKAADGQVMAVEGLALPEPKTKQMGGILRNLGVRRTFLVVVTDNNPELWRCTRNIRGAAMMTYRELNTYEMIRPDRVIFALEALQRFLQEAAPAATTAAAPDEAAAPEAAGEQVGVSENG
jgi:large subunit ribosomal protein L4